MSARILLVEDDPPLAALMRRYLERLGHEVEVCDRGEAAWTRFREAAGGYELVIVDLSLPDVPGTELLGRMLDQYPGTRALVCSGSPAPQALTGRRGVSVLEKPFLPAALAESVEKALAG